VTKISKLGSISDMLRATYHAGVTVCNRDRESGFPKCQCLPLPGDARSNFHRLILLCHSNPVWIPVSPLELRSHPFYEGNLPFPLATSIRFRCLFRPPWPRTRMKGRPCRRIAADIEPRNRERMTLLRPCRLGRACTRDGCWYRHSNGRTIDKQDGEEEKGAEADGERCSLLCCDTRVSTHDAGENLKTTEKCTHARSVCQCDRCLQRHVQEEARCSKEIAGQWPASEFYFSSVIHIV
jgi:hypothetical protein